MSKSRSRGRPRYPSGCDLSLRKPRPPWRKSYWRPLPSSNSEARSSLTHISLPVATACSTPLPLGDYSKKYPRRRSRDDPAQWTRFPVWRTTSGIPEDLCCKGPQLSSLCTKTAIPSTGPESKIWYPNDMLCQAITAAAMSVGADSLLGRVQEHQQQGGPHCHHL